MTTPNKTFGAFSAQRRCVARRNGDVDETLRFADGKHVFYAEQRCPRSFSAITDADILCQHCRSSKYTLINGLVTGPIPHVSHMYGGEWYKKKILTWGEPSAAHLAIAKKMQERCALHTRNGLPLKTNEPAAAKTNEPAAAKTNEPAAAKTRKFKVVKSVPTPPASESSCSSEHESSGSEEAAPLPPKTAAAVAFFKGKVRKMKVVKQEPVKPPYVEPLAIESKDAPMREGDLDENGNEITVEHRIVKKTYVPFLGRDVYMDTASQDAYEINPDGGVGKKINDDDV